MQILTMNTIKYCKVCHLNYFGVTMTQSADLSGMVSGLEVSKRPSSVLHPLHVFSSWLWCGTSKRDFKASSKEREECLCEENVNTWSLSAQSNYLSANKLMEKAAPGFYQQDDTIFVALKLIRNVVRRCKLWKVLECSREAKIRNGQRQRYSTETWVTFINQHRPRDIINQPVLIQPNKIIKLPTQTESWLALLHCTLDTVPSKDVYWCVPHSFSYLSRS